MARKPKNFEWVGFTDAQRQLLDFLDHLGNNGWARNSQTDELMVGELSEAADIGLTIEQIKEAMRAIGYQPHALRQLDRWESKRTTGKFGR